MSLMFSDQIRAGRNWRYFQFSLQIPAVHYFPGLWPSTDLMTINVLNICAEPRNILLTLYRKIILKKLEYLGLKQFAFTFSNFINQ